jgi:hypothetical protein
VMFHTYTTSSWMGMNLARITITKGLPGQLEHLIADGIVSPVAGDGPFAPLVNYRGHFAVHASTGSPVLDDPTKLDGHPNFNDINYITISNHLLAADLAFIRVYPGTYARNVSRATELFFVPTDQTQFVAANGAHIAGYEKLYDELIDWQPVEANASTIMTLAVAGTFPPVSRTSIEGILLFVVALAGCPVVVWRRRQDHPFALTLYFLWISMAYVLLLTNLIELGENERFRYDLGPLPLVVAVAVVASLLPRSGHKHAHSRLRAVSQQEDGS